MPDGRNIQPNTHADGAAHATTMTTTTATTTTTTTPTTTILATCTHQHKLHEDCCCVYDDDMKPSTTTTKIATSLSSSAASNKQPPRPTRTSSKLQPSPSSASSHSNTSSLFRDDGFEDDLNSTASEHGSSSTYNRHNRFSILSASLRGRRASRNGPCRSCAADKTTTRGDVTLGTDGHEVSESCAGEEEDEYRSCEEEFSRSNTTTTSASTASYVDDCALSTTSSSIIHHEQPIFDKVTLAEAKREYRKSLILEHQQLQHLYQNSSQNKIQALLQPSPQLCLPPAIENAQYSANSSVATTLSSAFSSTSSSASSNSSNQATAITKPPKCDDRTVNIVGHMPTRSPGYWDSNLSITQRVVTEIIETERAYVDDLEQIVTGYICYLRNVLKQRRRQRQQQFSQQRATTNVNSLAKDSQLPVASLREFEDDGKSLLTFDGEAADATNEVDDDDVDEVDQDIATKENVNTSGKEQDNNNETCPTDTSVASSIDIKKLFSNLEDIYKFNKDLLFRLEECYLNPSSVAECFVENASGFEVYTHYCTVYPQVVSTLTELMANPTTAQLLKERQSELNQSLPLGAYLLKPVQRILKYHILFQSLIKHTTDDESVNDKDRQLITEAFSVMTSIASHINSMKKRHEHSIRVQEVQGLLCGWEGPDLTTLGELILEDSFKLCNRQKSSRHLFLFDNVLLITKKKRDGSLCYKDHIECSNLMLIENIEGQPLLFNTVPFDNPKALCAFQAKSLDKKRDWCLRMKEVIIKSFEVNIPSHAKDLLMSLTHSGSGNLDIRSKSYEASRAIRTPNYLERKRNKDKKK